MRTRVVHFEHDSPAQIEAQELLNRLAGDVTREPSLTDALRQLLEPLAAGHTVRITEDNDYYTPSEAGRMLGVSRQYVDKLIARGELEATHKPQSSHRLINVSDIEALRAKRDMRRQGVDAMVDTLLDSGAEY